MCHSVEMYLPSMARDGAEHRIGTADFAAAERERRAVGMGLALLGRIGRLAGFLLVYIGVSTRGHIANLLKNKKRRFKRESWLMEHGEQEANGRPLAKEARA